MITLLQNISTQEYVSLNYQNSEPAANTLEFNICPKQK